MDPLKELAAQWFASPFPRCSEYGQKLCLQIRNHMKWTKNKYKFEK